MIPDHRLAVLLDHVKSSQINQCLYHNTAESPSLYSDHICDRSEFPLRTAFELSQHTDEVWYVEFSHDGTKLATTSKDHSVIVYDVRTFDIIHRLTDHSDSVASAAWSPDDSKLITCSQDYKARLWDIKVSYILIMKFYLGFDANPVLDRSLYLNNWSPQSARHLCGLGSRWRIICHRLPG